MIDKCNSKERPSFRSLFTVNVNSCVLDAVSERDKYY